MWRVTALVLLVLGGVVFGGTAKLPITADVGICAHPKEVSLNTGGSGRVRVKGNEHYYLFNFDVSKIRHYRITSATLHLKLARGRIRRAGVCTVPIPWVEGTAAGKAQTGSSCFTHVEFPKKAWTPGGGTVMDATFNSPDMMWRPASVTTARDGWMTIRLDPKLVQAVAAGFSRGLILSSETGQTRENHDVFTREQGNSKPYLTVTCFPPLPKPLPPRPPVKATPCPTAAGFNSGAISVTAGLPAGAFGNMIVLTEWPDTKMVGGAVVRTEFHGREVIFRGLKPRRGYSISVVSPVKSGGSIMFGSRRSIKASAALAAPKAVKLPPVGKISSVEKNGWKLIPLSGTARTPTDAIPAAGAIDIPVTASGAWVGFQVAICPPKGAAEKVYVDLRPLWLGLALEMRTPPLKPVRVYRVWSVPKDKKHFGEVLVPLEEGKEFPIPWDTNKVSGQKSQTVFVDIWVPAKTWPGMYKSELTVTQGGKKVADLPLQVRVARVALDDTFHIAADMNTYSSPARAMGVCNSDAKAFMAAERKYYRLAHAHRMTLAVLPYSQSGSIAWRGAPKISGSGAKCKVSDWSDWDERYGPLLDGSAFTFKNGYVGPGAGRPLRNIYLPLHENWPSALAGGKNFKPWPPPRDYQKMLEWTADLPPVEKSLSPDVSTAWVSVLQDFKRHLGAKGWTKTKYQIYLNNKFYFRRNNGRGISLWLLDEPMAPDDFLALRHFGRMTKQAVLLSSPTAVEFRLDISRPTHQRDWLDGLVDLNVCAGQLYSQRRLIARRKRVLGEEYWNYRMPKSFGANNTGWAVWPVRSLCWGAGGTVPWQTIASDGDLQKADATALMYPGRKFGLNEPLASIRMKAWRQGLQDAELLLMLKKKRGYNDLQLRAFVGAACGLTGALSGMDPKPDDSIVTFAGMTDAKLSTLRRAILTALK